MDPYGILSQSFFFFLFLFNLSLFALGCTCGVVEHDASYSALMILSGVGKMKDLLTPAYDLSSPFPYLFPSSIFFGVFFSSLLCLPIPHAPDHTLSLLLLLALNSAVTPCHRGRTGKSVCLACCSKGVLCFMHMLIFV